jgi:hypothetical protein
MDEGWTRYMFEREAGVPYTTLHDADVQAGRLRDRFDAIVLPDQSRDRMMKGYGAGEMPAEFSGGLGDAGVRSLRAFVEAGGSLIALNGATAMPIAEFPLPVKNGLAGIKNEDFYCPGAILRVRVDAETILGHGMDEATPIWFEGSPAFEAAGGRVVARYGEDDALLSGWLMGGSHLHGKAALLDVPLGKGHVVLFGFRPQYRGQSWATYVPLLNALYASAAPAANR